MAPRGSLRASHSVGGWILDRLVLPWDWRRPDYSTQSGLTGDTAQAVASVEQIAADLTARGIPTKTRKSEHWTHQTVARMGRRGRSDVSA